MFAYTVRKTILEIALVVVARSCRQLAEAVPLVVLEGTLVEVAFCCCEFSLIRTLTIGKLSLIA